ncbi:MAG: FAD binding domain-containing protein [bacterium]|jgi:xanthine dehydrogenase YagS FAD-binding subunit
MNRFSFYKAGNPREALEQVNATVSETLQPNPPESSAVIKAGGIDILDLMKEGLSAPSKLVSINEIPGMRDMVFDEKKGLRMGATVTLSEIAGHDTVKERYFALHQAAAKAATPQIRNMATLGGNLAQRTRCWYFRSKAHVCFRKGGDTCFARFGENIYHAIMQNDDCASVHSSSLSTALLAFDAAVEITNGEGKVKVVPVGEFFVSPSIDQTKENILNRNELITAVIVPTPKENVRSHYTKMGERESHDWPIADVAVVAEMNGAKCKKAHIALGAAAPVPLLANAAMEMIKGETIDEEVAGKAASKAMEEATPLSQNAYKVQVFETLIRRNLLAML